MRRELLSGVAQGGGVRYLPQTDEGGSTVKWENPHSIKMGCNSTRKANTHTQSGDNLLRLFGGGDE